MNYIFMAIGTILAILFLVHLKKGSGYSTWVENLNENDFPMHELYVVGLSWNSTKLLSLKGKLATKLKDLASLLYEPQYAEYYATIAWAQTITLVHLFLSVTFLAAGMLVDASVLILVGGIFLSIIVAVYGLENMKNLVSKRTEACEYQLPEIVSTMAILVNSGMILKEAWTTVAYSREGEFYDLMKNASINMQNGYSDADAIFLFGRNSNSVEIKKFTSALLQSLEKGGGELAVFLAQQSSELWNTKRQRMVQEGERAATKLLLPIVLIFVGIIIIVMTAAFAGSLF